MSDADLRALERTWRATGAVEDEARWHVARLRAGALTAERLRLAAWAGHPAATLAAREAAIDVPGAVTAPFDDDWARFGRWQTALRAFEHAAQARAGLATAEVVMRALGDPTSIGLSAPTDAARPALDACRRALRALSDDRARAILAADRRTTGRRLGRLASLIEAPPVLRPLAVIAEEALSDDTPAWSTRWPRSAKQARERAGVEPARRLPDLVASATRDAVAPWALGLEDPLAVRARRKLDTIEIAAPCAASWDAMTPVEAEGRSRRCTQCSLVVHDLSARTREEAEALLGAHPDGRLCVQLYRRADGTIITRDCPDGIDALVAPFVPRTLERGGLRA